MRQRVLAIASLVAASACSSSAPTGPTPATIIGRAPDRARSAGSVTIATAITLPLAGSKRPAVLTGHATIDFAHHLATSSIEVRQLMSALRARPGAPGTFDFLFAQGSLYMRLVPPRGTKEWARIASSALAGPSGGNPFAQLGGSDPNAAIEILRGAGGTVTRVGTAAVNNVRTTEYRVSLDVAKASAAGGTTVAAALRAEFRTTAAIDARVWIDTRGRPAREIFTFGGPSGATTVRHDFTGYGAPLAIKTPPGAQVLIVRDAAAFGLLFQQTLTGGKTARSG